MARLIAVVVLVGLGAAVATAAATLPWWATLTAIVLGAAALVAAVPILIGAGLRGVARSLFDAKSRVLRGATARVHNAQWCERPAPHASHDDDACDLASEPDPFPDAAGFIAIDATITPGSCDGPMQLWDPWDIVLVPIDADVSMEEMERDDHEEAPFAEPADIRLPSGERPDKLQGEHRLRFVFACPTGLAPRLKFRYFFEAFGEVSLPPAGAERARRAA